MLMDHEKSLFLKYLDGKASPDEKQQLLAYLKNNASAREELQPTYRQWADERGRSFDPYPSLDRVLQKVSRGRSFGTFPALAMAAVAAALAAILIIPALTRHHAPAPKAAKSKVALKV